MSYQVNWEIQALDQAAGFLRDDPVGVAALWDAVAGKTGTRHPHPAGEPYATQSGKARVTAAVRLDTCSLV